MRDHSPRDLTFTLPPLPPLTPAQADAILHALGALQDAFYAAYEHELLEAVTQAGAAAEDDREQDERADEYFWEHLLDP
jgi:hypothetical protein